MATMATMRRTGQLAIASGIVGVLATVVLIAFYVLEAPQAVAAGAKTAPLGAANDALGGVEYLVLVPVAAMLRPAGNRLSLLAAIGGVAGLVGVALAQELYVFGAIGPAVDYPAIAVGNGLIGVWIATVSLVAPHSVHLPRGLTLFGVAIGAGMLLIPVGVFLLGGLGVMTAPKLLLNNIPFFVTVGIAIIAIAVGMPIWSMWLGRHLVMTKLAAA
jgi:hypothetical protein